tara:strand:- start:800 stop:1645 length:846 start_codon:yes stop_codon:yes gene_type:complete
MNIIGLGSAGCKITQSFEQYTQYNTYYIDTKNSYGETKNFVKIKEQAKHEDYEKNYKPLNKLKNVSGETTLILAGSGNISGAVLRLLEQLKKEKITILYVKPDMSTASEEAAVKEKIVFGVLQQYARSSLIERLYVVSNVQLETVLDAVSIVDYWANINKVISSTYHMLNVFENTEPLLTSLSEPKKTNRIATLGVISFANLDEKIFYSLQKPRLKKYFFGISEATLNEEKDLLQKIRTYTKSKSEEKCTACFAIYSTNYEQDYAYVVQYASLIQEQNLDS